MTEIDKININRIFVLIFHFFDYDVEKSNLWLETKNPAIGGITPMEMILNGRADKLLLFIENSIAGNFP